MARVGKRFQIQLSPDVFKVLEDESNRYGVSRSAYISMLIMKNKTETSAVDFLSRLSPDQINAAIEEQEAQR